jgi:hypothetical protein
MQQPLQPSAGRLRFIDTIAQQRLHMESVQPLFDFAHRFEYPVLAIIAALRWVAQRRVSCVSADAIILPSAAASSFAPRVYLGAAPVAAIRLAQKCWSPPMGRTTCGTPARAAVCTVPAPPW